MGLSKFSLRRVVMFLMLICFLTANICGCGSKDPNEGKSVEKTKDGNFEISIAVPEGDFKKGKKVPVSVTVKNTGGTIEVLHYNTAQRFDLEVKDSQGKPLWRWSVGQYFAQSFEQVKLKPDDSENDHATWMQKDQAGNQVAPGTYTLIARSTADEVSKTVSIKIKIVK